MMAVFVTRLDQKIGFQDGRAGSTMAPSSGEPICRMQLTMERSTVMAVPVGGAQPWDLLSQNHPSYHFEDGMATA